MIKYALIGCGRISINHIKAVEKQNKDVQNKKINIVALCDTDISKAYKLREKAEGIKESEKDKAQNHAGHDIEVYQDYKKMIREHPEINLIAISTQSGYHAEIAKYCIKHRINVIIEKPIALSIDDADEIIKLQEQTGVKVCVSHQNRFNRAIQKLRTEIENKTLGKISHGSISVRWNRDKNYYDQASWRGTWEQDGGCLMNQCIHGIDLLIWMLGDVKSVYGVVRNEFHNYIQAEDLGMAILEFKNGSVATIEGTTNIYNKNLAETLSIFGETGTVRIGGTQCNKIDTWDIKGENIEDESENVENVYGNGHMSLYADMIDAIESNRQPYISAVDGRNALEIVLAIYKSMQTGEKVILPLSNYQTMDMINKEL